MLSASENEGAIAPASKRSRLQRALRVEWLGQTAASLFWITSVFVYGEYGTGDWLQLLAACSWFLANIAAIVSDEGE